MTVIGGKEDSIVDQLKDKLATFKYGDYVKEIKIIKIKNTTVTDYSKDDPKLPANLKDTSSTKWEALPNGGYRKYSSRIVNKFPGYVFINMQYSEDLWFTIRNTPGVLGFVGSTGKGAKPIPISEYEYRKAVGFDGTSQKEVVSEQIVTNLKVGDNVTIIGSEFAGQSGVIKSISGLNADVAIEIFNREQIITVSLNNLARR